MQIIIVHFAVILYNRDINLFYVNRTNIQSDLLYNTTLCEIVRITYFACIGLIVKRLIEWLCIRLSGRCDEVRKLTKGQSKP